MRRGLLYVLSAVCCNSLLVAAAPGQSAGGDQLVRGQSGEYSIRLPLGWKTRIAGKEIEATANGIWMKLYCGELFLSLDHALGLLFEDMKQSWTDITAGSIHKITIGDTAAHESEDHGVNEHGVRTTRRTTAFNPEGPGHHGCVFLFEVPEPAYDRALPALLRIEQSFHMGPDNSAPPYPEPDRKSAVNDRPAPGPAPGVAGRLELYVAPNKLYALYKPADWRVTEATGDGTFAITVTSPDRAQVNLLWMRASRPNLLRFMATSRGALAQTYPGAAYSDIHVSRDGTRGVATLTYPLGNLRAHGRVYFEATATGAAMQEYAAPEQLLAAQRPLLLNVMASVSFINPPRNGNGRGGEAAPVQVPLVERHASDGSLSLRMPDDWAFQAGRGHVIAGKPGAGMGFIFTSFGGNPMRIMAKATIAQGVIASPYRRPSQTLPLILRGFGHRDIAILSTAEDRASMAECAGSLRGAGCEAEDMLAQWTSEDGMDCVGGFKVVNTRPGAMGQWSSIVAGIWGPRKEIGRYVPMLVQVGNSFSINGQYARSYIAAGLENLQRLKRETTAAMADLRYAREDMQRAWEQREARKDYMDSKWDDYRRGNSYWVSDLEGGRVYHTDTWGTRDTLTGDYYEGGAYTWTNFEGQNPHFPSESMREVSSYELEHGGPPR